MGANGIDLSNINDIELSNDYIEESVTTNRSAYISSNQLLQTPDLESSVTTTILEPIDLDSNSLDFGEIVSKIATRDVKAQPPIIENPPDSDWGNTRIIQMIKNVFPSRRGPQGVAWCACAVTTWWKEAAAQKGIQAPLPGSGQTTDPRIPISSNGYVPRWEYWAKTTRRFSPTPVIGAAILYNPAVRAAADGTSTVAGSGFASHIGIVQSINTDGTFNAIDGNYSKKISFRPNLSTSRGVIGFVLPII